MRARAGVAVAAVVAGAAAAAVVPSLTGTSGALILLTAGTAGLGVVVAWERSRSGYGLARLSPEADTADEAPAPGLRLARWLFYVGLLTVSIMEWRPAIGLTPFEICFIASFAVCVGSVLLGGAVARLPGALVIGAGLFAAGGAVSSVGAEAPGQSVVEVLQGVYVMLLWFWTGTMVLRTGDHIRTALTLFTVSSAVCGLGAIWQVLGIEIFTGPAGGGRANSWAGHPNDLGGMMAVALVPALALASWSRPGGRSLLRWLAVGSIGAGLVLSGSVAGMTAAVLAVVVWLGVAGVRQQLRVAGAVALVCVATTAFIGSGRAASPIQRFQQVSIESATDVERGTGPARIPPIKAAWEAISESPVVGKGMDKNGRAVSYFDNGRTSRGILHGAPVAVWYQAGGLGFLGYMLVTLTILAAGWRGMLATRSSQERSLGWALAAAYLAFFVWSLSSPLFFTQYGWLAGVLTVAWCLRREPLREPIAAFPRTGARGLLPPRSDLGEPRPAWE